VEAQRTNRGVHVIKTIERPGAEPVTDQAEHLQHTLVELIELSLQAKQAHWNVVGPTFKPVHEFLDELTDQYRTWYDDVAERMTAIGAAPDGRSATVASARSFDPLPAGSHEAARLIRIFEEHVTVFASRLSERADLVSGDLATQDLLIEILRGAEKQRWMLRAHRPG
jgi:starvation-inducible DNA-binding protein